MNIEKPDIIRKLFPDYYIGSRYPLLPVEDFGTGSDPYIYPSHDVVQKIIVKGDRNDRWRDIVYHYNRVGCFVKLERSGGFLGSNKETKKFNDKGDMIELYKQKNTMEGSLISKENFEFDYKYENNNVTSLSIKSNKEFLDMKFYPEGRIYDEFITKEQYIREKETYSYHYYYYNEELNETILEVDFKNGEMYRYILNKNELNKIISIEESSIKGLKIDKKSFKYDPNIFKNKIRLREYEYNGNGKVSKIIYYPIKNGEIGRPTKREYDYHDDYRWKYLISREVIEVPSGKYGFNKYEHIYSYDSFHNVIELDIRNYKNGSHVEFNDEKYKIENEYEDVFLIKSTKQLFKGIFEQKSEKTSTFFKYD